jgi:LysR family glycine cleavage system transcriptional activator
MKQGRKVTFPIPLGRVFSTASLDWGRPALLGTFRDVASSRLKVNSGIAPGLKDTGMATPPIRSRKQSTAQADRSTTPPPQSPLPPLMLLRAFDAAGRQLSFKLAASELLVTPSTISHQISDLERYMGVQLFRRLPTGLLLTVEGSTLLDDVAAAFARLREATSRLRQHGQPVLIRVGANPFLAAELLVPLIPAFEAAFPGHSIHISGTEALEDPRDGSVDLCVRFGDGSWPGLTVQSLCDVSAVAVVAANCSEIPSARIDYPFRGHSAWATWKARGGAQLPCGSRVRSFSSFGAAMRAVEQGLGVSLSLWPVVQPWIRTGRIRCYHAEHKLPLGELYLVSRTLTPAQRTLRQVFDWLRAALIAELQV